MSTIVMPGGTGFLGRHLTGALAERGHEVVVLTRGRSGGPHAGGVRFVHWDAATLGEWTRELDGADAVVHLTGRTVDCRPTRRNREALIRSRVEPVRLVGRALAGATSPPAVWVQSGTLAVFGDTGEQVITDDDEPSGVGPPQMVQVALAWERAAALASAGVDRSVLLRIGVSIGGRDPATMRLAQLARLGLGGSVAGGSQWVSWVALDDVVQVVVRTVEEPSMTGTYHVTSPSPVRNADLMAAVRGAVGRRVGLGAPAIATRVGALAMGTDPALALTGRRCLPTRLQDEGVVLNGDDVGDALRAALR